MTALLSLLTLWILARIRYPDRPVTPNPVPPLLSQLTSTPRFDDLASQLAQLRNQVAPSLIVLRFAAREDPDGEQQHRIAALRIRDDVAVLPPSSESHEPSARAGVIAEDPVSGLALIRTTSDIQAVVPALWPGERLDQSRYLIAGTVVGDNIAVKPAFVGSMMPTIAAAWPGPVWKIPGNSDLTAGSFVFTEDAELVGLVVEDNRELAVIPATMLLAEADRLLNQPPKPAADLGVQVQTLTPRLALATGADAGVLVTWIDPDSVAAGALQIGDVIQAVDGVSVPTTAYWRVRVARIGIGDTATLSVLRTGQPVEVQLAAISPPATKATAPFGLTLRNVPGVGAEVVLVEHSSAADAGGVRAGDLITVAGKIHAPTAFQLRSAFAASTPSQPLIVALTRGAAHRVVAVSK